MSNVAIIPQRNTFSLTPSSLEEAMKFAEIMAKSSIVPKGYQGKAADILVAVQMGAELGLKPIQALQNIAVINGKPSVYGDAMLALVQANSAFEDIKEHFDEKLQAAVCIVKRINQSEHTVIYSIEDAKKAGLWNKSGPWQQYPKRMLQMRARGFALRDKFADALGGLISAEEARDYPIDVTPKPQISKSQTLNERLDSLLDTGINTEAQEVIEVNEITPRDKLYQLIQDSETPDETVDKWCKKAEVSTLEELDDDKVNALINMLEKQSIENK
jgi:hypothetical protein